MNNSSNSIAELTELWELLFPGVPTPTPAQWAIWHLRHSSTVVRKGIAELAARFTKMGGDMEPVHMGKFASAVMNRLTSDRGGNR